MGYDSRPCLETSWKQQLVHRSLSGSDWPEAAFPTESPRATMYAQCSSRFDLARSLAFLNRENRLCRFLWLCCITISLLRQSWFNTWHVRTREKYARIAVYFQIRVTRDVPNRNVVVCCAARWHGLTIELAGHVPWAKAFPREHWIASAFWLEMGKVWV